jgi:hypothetical protein
MHRSIYVIFFSALTAAGTVGGGCAQPGHTSPFGGDGGGGGSGGSGGVGGDAQPNFDTYVPPPDLDSGAPQGTCMKGLKTITISPATTSVSITYSATLPTTKQAFTAQGTYSTGMTADVTACLGWTTSPPSLATISQAGAFSTDNAGQFTVTGTSDGVSGTAVITVKLTGSANPGGITTTDLDGTPNGAAPTIAYPLNLSLFPFHFGDLAFQMVPSSSSQTEARIAFVGDAIDLDLYAPCTPIANAATSGACSVAIPANLEPSLAGASEATNLTETVRLAAPGGSNLAESSSISARWASNPLPGTIYYWSTPSMGQTANSEIIRMNLETPTIPPEVFFTNDDAVPYGQVGYTNDLNGGSQCIGCHAISRDGTKMGFVIGGAAVLTAPNGSNGGGNGSWFGLMDVANKTPISARVADSTGQFLKPGFATLTTFSSSGDDMVQELQGQLFLRTADVNLTSTPLFPSMTESLTEPYWSYAGDLLTFASWVPTGAPNYDPQDINGNEIVGAQIWTASSTGTTFGTPTVLVPRTSGLTEFYPTISEDSQLIAFDESSCAGPPSPSADGYGASPCDSYDDPSAHLRLVSAKGGTPVNLDNASQRTMSWPTTSTWTNSWPRFAPPAPSGTPPSTFQGKTLYWIAFSSRLPYGATLAGSQTGATPPQIWFAAVAIDSSGTLSGDPSFAPVWLPQQNSATPEILLDGGTSQTLGGDGKPTGNHVPQWAYQYVPFKPPPPKDGGYYPPPPPQ